MKAKIKMVMIKYNLEENNKHDINIILTALKCIICKIVHINFQI